MQSIITLVAASALIVRVSAFPLVVRSTCGSSPAGSGSETPISQPSGITTASACQAQCEANTSCQSFVFGMVNNAIECQLYSVPAAQVPQQSSSNLVVYDKACASVPAVVPTSSNPTGAANLKLVVRDTCGAAPSASGNQVPLSQPAGITTASACQAQCEANASCLSFVFGMVNSADQCILYSVVASAIPVQSSTNLVAYDKACTSVPAVVPTAANPTGAANLKLVVRDTCGAAPSASGNQAPLSQPAGITTASACQAQCEADASCQSFVFGMVNSADQCTLYSVAASAIPAQSSTNLVAYDKACTSVPAVVPTAANPTGAATGSSTTPNTGTNAGTSNGAQGGSHKRGTCGATPTGPAGNANPIAAPQNINSVADCKTQCHANASCKSYEFGAETSGGANACRLFSVAASSVPAPTPGQSFAVYDIGC